MSQRVKIIITAPGSKSKSELRSWHDGTWTLCDFEYAEDGERTKVKEQRGMSHQEAIEVIKIDPEFYRSLEELAVEMHLVGGDPS